MLIHCNVSAYLLERRGTLDLGHLSLLAPADAGGGGVQGVVGGGPGLLLVVVALGRHTTGARAVEGGRRPHCRGRRAVSSNLRVRFTWLCLYHDLIIKTEGEVKLVEPTLVN